jgi:lysyl endopeptidase
MKKYLILIVILLTAFSGYSVIETGNLEGIVSEAGSGNPIQGAHIQFIGASYNGTTNALGYYTFSYVPSGTYVIQCTKEGYGTQTANIIISDNNTTIQNFQMEILNLAPPENLDGIYQGYLYLYWDPPGGTSEWIQWDDGVNLQGIGLSSGGVFYVASHWEPSDLEPYDGMSMTKISFFPYGNPTATFQLYVWNGHNATNQVMTQAVDNFTVNEWNEVTLSSAVLIDASDELWFGYSVTHESGSLPAGCDNGTEISGKGDMISFDGINWVPMGITYGLEYNWNLAAFVEPTDNSLPAKPMVKSIISSTSSSFSSVKEICLSGNNQKKFTTTGSKDLSGYNVYHSINCGLFSLEAYTEETNYTLNICTWEINSFYVTAVYDEGESLPSNTLTITFPAIAEQATSGVKISPNPSKDWFNINSEENLKSIALYNSFGQLIEKELVNANEYRFETSRYDSGVYFLKIELGESIITRRIAIE